jgi:hypothetical protein
MDTLERLPKAADTFAAVTVLRDHVSGVLSADHFANPSEDGTAERVAKNVNWSG